MAGTTTDTKRNTSDVYDGPMPKQMIAERTLAREIINRHMNPCPILDDPSILVLREFVKDPASAQTILDRIKDKPEGHPEQSLVAYVMKLHGTGEPALTDDEIAALREWFENGGGKTDDELASPI